MAGDDASLVRRAQSGDHAAFAELVASYHRPLYGYVLGLTRDHEAAADVTQEVFVRAWRYLAKFDTSRPFRPWLYRIAANRAMTRQGQRERRATVSLDEIEVEPVAPDDVSASLARQELADEVRAAIGRLSAQQQQALVLVELEGHSAVDAAELMGCSAATVRQHLFRGKKRLHGLLRDYVGGQGQA